MVRNYRDLFCFTLWSWNLRSNIYNQNRIKLKESIYSQRNELNLETFQGKYLHFEVWDKISNRLISVSPTKRRLLFPFLPVRKGNKEFEETTTREWDWSWCSTGKKVKSSDTINTYRTDVHCFWFVLSNSIFSVL